MSWVVIDEEKCNSCGICALRCARCFSAAGKKISVHADENCCIICGHCVALCPTGALTHHRMDASNFEAAGAPIRFEAEAFMRFIRQRRSHRHFTKKVVSETVVRRLIEAARYAAYRRLSSSRVKGPHLTPVTVNLG